MPSNRPRDSFLVRYVCQQVGVESSRLSDSVCWTARCGSACDTLDHFSDLHFEALVATLTKDHTEYTNVDVERLYKPERHRGTEVRRAATRVRRNTRISRRRHHGKYRAVRGAGREMPR